MMKQSQWLRAGPRRSDGHGDGDTLQVCNRERFERPQHATLGDGSKSLLHPYSLAKFTQDLRPYAKIKITQNQPQQAPPGEVTRLLLEWRDGNPAALEAVTPFIYGELKTMASAYMRREREDHTLQPTALVHEAYLRLAGNSAPAWEDRTHFYSIAARLMRQILVDHARKHLTGKRGDGMRPVTLNEAVVFAPGNAEQFLGISEALDRLALLDERKARAVEMRFFGGLTVDEIAPLLKVSAMTVNRDLRFAEAWLFSQLGGAS